MTRLVTYTPVDCATLYYFVHYASALGRRIDKMTLMGKHYAPVNGVKA